MILFKTKLAPGVKPFTVLRGMIHQKKILLRPYRCLVASDDHRRRKAQLTAHGFSIAVAPLVRERDGGNTNFVVGWQTEPAPALNPAAAAAVTHSSTTAGFFCTATSVVFLPFVSSELRHSSVELCIRFSPPVVSETARRRQSRKEGVEASVTCGTTTGARYRGLQTFRVSLSMPRGLR